jgi:hypothetical protein
LNPNFLEENLPSGMTIPTLTGQDVMVNHDLQTVLQFVASAAVGDFIEDSGRLSGITVPLFIVWKRKRIG